MAEVAVACVTAGVLGLSLSRLLAAPSLSRGLFLGACLVPLIAVAVGHVGRLLLALMVLDVPLQLDVNLFYREDAASIGAIGGLSISVTSAALAGLYGLWIARLVLSPADAVKPRFGSGLPLLAYVTINVISIFVAREADLAGFEVAMLVQCLLAYVYIASHVRSEADVRFVVVVLIGALLIEGAVLVALWSGLSVPLAKGSLPGTSGSATRFGGTVGGPNSAASFLVALLAPTLAVVVTPVRRVVKWVALAAFVLGTLGLVITGSRGGIVAGSISLVVLAAFGLRHRWLRTSHVLVGLVVVAIAVLPLLSVATTRFTADDKGSGRSRVPLNRLATDVIRLHPWTGVGANNVGLEMKRTAGPEYSRDWIYTVHNKYLLVAAEVGIVGLAVFLWFLWSSFRRGAVAARSGGHLVGPLAAGVTAGFVGQIVHMTVEIFQSRPQVQLLLLTAGLLAAMAAIGAPGCSLTPRVAERGLVPA